MSVIGQGRTCSCLEEQDEPGDDRENPLDLAHLLFRLRSFLTSGWARSTWPVSNAGSAPLRCEFVTIGCEHQRRIGNVTNAISRVRKRDTRLLGIRNLRPQTVALTTLPTGR